MHRGPPARPANLHERDQRASLLGLVSGLNAWPNSPATKSVAGHANEVSVLPAASGRGWGSEWSGTRSGSVGSQVSVHRVAVDPVLPGQLSLGHPGSSLSPQLGDLLGGQ